VDDGHVCLNGTANKLRLLLAVAVDVDNSVGASSQ
jgi:hypothetical protein